MAASVLRMLCRWRGGVVVVVYGKMAEGNGLWMDGVCVLAELLGIGRNGVVARTDAMDVCI